MKFCDSTLFESPYDYTLCTKEKQFDKVMKRLKVPKVSRPGFMAAGADACVWFLTSDRFNIAVVCMGDTEGKSMPQIHAMLVHEAVHIWQKICKTVGERRPSSEFEAYSVQMISQRLMELYHAQTDKQQTPEEV